MTLALSTQLWLPLVCVCVCVKFQESFPRSEFLYCILQPLFVGSDKVFDYTDSDFQRGGGGAPLSPAHSPF